MDENQKKVDLAIGGQAVMEGVMMRGPKYIATAIRRKDKTIEVKKREFTSITKKIKFLGLPIIRGFASLIEMMFVGFETLTFSAERASLDFDEPQNQQPIKGSTVIKEKLMEGLSIIIALGLFIFLFIYLPYKIPEWLGLGRASIYFNLLAGVIRVIFFIIYLLLISLMKDIRRVFQYHGAEHKTVFTYESEQPLIPENIQKFSRLHPRCGTSFIFFVLLISIIIFSIVDSLVIHYIGMPNLPVRIAYHILFLTPFISGISYEVLKLSSKKKNNPFIKMMIFPGMSLQRITTQPPDNEQVEVASVALKAALEMDLSDKNIVWLN